MPRRHGRARPFIDKKNAEHFVLMHRSQQDPKYYDEDASRYVLMSTRAQFATPLYAGPEDVEEDGDEALDGAALLHGDGSDDGSAGESGSRRGAQHAASAAAPARRGVVTGRHAFTDDMYAPSAAVGSTQEGRARDRAAGGGSKRRKPVARDVLVKPVGAAVARHGVHEVSEVDEYGFPLDGYDYSRHMREMGGGTFVSATGSVMAAARVAATHTAAAKMDLPEEVLPARPEDELDRMLEAISMRPEKLPKDIRAALEAAEEMDEEQLEEAGVQELDDNFVMQAAGEEEAEPAAESASATAPGASSGEADDFDFDAHIARLMAASEGVWTDTADDFDGDEGEEEGDDEEEEEDEEDGDEDSSFAVRRQGGHSATGRGDDALLAAVLEEYDDDQIGELDEDDPRLHQTELPQAAPPPSDDNSELPERVTRFEALSSLMDQYLAEVEQEKIDSMLVTGVRPGTRTVPGRPGLFSELPVASTIVDTVDTTTEAATPTETAATAAPTASTAAFSVSAVRASTLATASQPDAVPVTAAPATRMTVPFGFAEGDFEYDGDSALAAALRAPAKPKWDVETVISTYTNTENHPKKLSGGVSITSSRTGHAARKIGVSVDATSDGTPAPTVIRLSKKTGLPIISRPAVPVVAEAAEESGGSDADSADEDSDDAGTRSQMHVRSKTETPEERRARKAAVKAERRQRREEKKLLRVAYTSEQVRQAHLLQHRDVLAGSMPM